MLFIKINYVIICLNMSLNLEFKLSENYLIAHLLSRTSVYDFSNDQYEKNIVAFQNYAWKLSEQLYHFVGGNDTSDIFIKNKKDLADLVITSIKYLDQLAASKLFSRLKRQTQEYLVVCQKQWDATYLESYEMITRLTGLKLKGKFIVYITHPSLRNGRKIGPNQIVWGNIEKWKNYTTVYLWHEILHAFFKTEDVDHCLIQFLTDEELRKHFNGGRYLTPYIGHEYLRPLMKKILPLWKKYLMRPNKNIRDFRNELCGDTNFRS